LIEDADEAARARGVRLAVTGGCAAMILWVRGLVHAPGAVAYRVFLFDRAFVG
jgi:hypothetical protein